MKKVDLFKSLLLLGISATIILSLIMSIKTYYSFQTYAAMMDNETELKELSHKIIYLDEVLTMSTLMACVTHDPRWEKRYHSFEPELNNAIKRSIALSPEIYSTRYAQKVDEANIKLIAMELKAFQLLRKKKFEQANQIIFGTEYQKQKTIYAKGTQHILDSINSRLLSNISSFEGKLLNIISFFMMSFIMLVGIWLVFFLWVKTHFKLKKETEVKLKESKALLEKEVALRTRELHAAQQELLNYAHESGMNQMGINVMHNVGNMLNSISFSIYELRELFKKSSKFKLYKTNDLIRKYEQDLDTFFYHEPKNKDILKYLLALQPHLELEDQKVQKISLQILNDLKVVNDTIITQMNESKMSDFTENMDFKEIILKVLDFHRPSLEAENIDIELDLHQYAIKANRHKIIHILTNLIKNAKESILLNQGNEKRISIVMSQCSNYIQLNISDTGMGISEQELNNVFKHGFTTKIDGNGFGLHSCANYMTEMDGTIEVFSRGVGQGATFILLFPQVDESCHPEPSQSIESSIVQLKKSLSKAKAI